MRHSPQLLFGPAAGALGNLSVADSSVPLSAVAPTAKHVADAYRRAGYLEVPSSGVTYGYAIGKVWGQLLKRACINANDPLREALELAAHRVALREWLDELDDKPGAPYPAQSPPRRS